MKERVRNPVNLKTQLFPFPADLNHVLESNGSVKKRTLVLLCSHTEETTRLIHPEIILMI